MSNTKKRNAMDHSFDEKGPTTPEGATGKALDAYDKEYPSLLHQNGGSNSSPLTTSKQDTVDEMIPRILKELKCLRRELAQKDNVIAELREEIAVLRGTITSLPPPALPVVNEIATDAQIAPSGAGCQNNECKIGLESLEQYARRNSLRINKIPVAELGNMSTDDFVLDLARRLGVQMDRNDISRSHVLGLPSYGTVNMVVKFVSYNARERLYKNKKRLKPLGLGIVIYESLTSHRREIFKVINALRYEKVLSNTWTTDGKILFKFDENSKSRNFPVHDIPFGMNYKSNVERMVYRWRSEEEDSRDELPEEAATGTMDPPVTQ